MIDKILEKLNSNTITSAYENHKLLKGLKRGDFLDLKKEDVLKHISSYEHSKSQLKQDIFVLHQLDFKKNGFFVEFGATNGVDLSNTHLLENQFNWKGILAEPAKDWHDDLKTNRNCNIETDCVWKDSETVLNFNETKHKELSTIKQFNDSDRHKKRRADGKSYQVNSISLIDLLDKYDAPKNIDYLSIDTEGSEYEILSHFDFNKYTFKVITVEHNFTESREKIFQLLKEKGYSRKYKALSKWDDWYVKV
ncbi:FkbM family methyltransferase [Gelidibacter pelagius]|uniref:FkbM family methyltransferase n=1 Tax=Gelidibacter pelagius TaxID=2819985 RepID=A0ABS3SW64_9FLAO|nr:FkbM family methyltransferase [Gelidibacter pelagius]MBO3099955.1 FkbM family methyltransferase [Gelidibacter pelagius]